MNFNTPEMQTLAKQMLERQQDYSPEADNILPSNRALCSYGVEAWIVDTHDDICMKQYTKIQRII